MGGSSKSKSKSRSQAESSSSRWGAWSEWVFDDDQNIEYRVRQDVNGNYDYGYRAPGEAQPRTKSKEAKGSRQKSHSSMPESEPSRWGAWSEWAFDHDQNLEYRVRQDANGNHDYDYRAPGDEESLPQPRTKSKEVKRSRHKGDTSRSEPGSSRWGNWSDWTFDQVQNVWYRCRQDADGNVDYEYGGPTERGVQTAPQTQYYPPTEDSYQPRTSFVPVFDDPYRNSIPLPVPYGGSQQATSSDAAPETQGLASFDDPNSDGLYSSSPMYSYNASPLHTGSSSNSYERSYGYADYTDQSATGGYKTATLGKGPSTKQSEKEWDKKRERDNKRRQENQRRFRHPERANSFPDNSDSDEGDSDEEDSSEEDSKERGSNRRGSNRRGSNKKGSKK